MDLNKIPLEKNMIESDETLDTNAIRKLQCELSQLASDEPASKNDVKEVIDALQSILDSCLDDKKSPSMLKDNSLHSNGDVTVYFKGIESQVLSQIKLADAVFGAVAWLTNYRILNELKRKDNVLIVLEKEEYLKKSYSEEYENDKPKKKAEKRNKTTLRTKYKELTLELTPYELGGIFENFSGEGNPVLESIRCVGSVESFSKMHNKFIVLAKVNKTTEYTLGIEIKKSIVKPYAVLTGSFNFSVNATNSLENCLLITEQKIVDAYYSEFLQILAVSENREWQCDTPKPDLKFDEEEC